MMTPLNRPVSECRVVHRRAFVFPGPCRALDNMNGVGPLSGRGLGGWALNERALNERALNERSASHGGHGAGGAVFFGALPPAGRMTRRTA
jgi:hypothetical protein